MSHLLRPIRQDGAVVCKTVAKCWSDPESFHGHTSLEAGQRVFIQRGCRKLPRRNVETQQNQNQRLLKDGFGYSSSDSESDKAGTNKAKPL